jgi:hypothetical protein
MLPEYIHMRVAESILFAGKAIRVLRNPSPGATLQEPVNQSQNSKGSHGMQSFVGGSGAPKELPSFSNISAEELLPQAEADKIDVMLKELKVSCQLGNFCWYCTVYVTTIFCCMRVSLLYYKSFLCYLHKMNILIWAYGCLRFLQHSSEFYKRPFESAVGSIRTIAANHLWQVLMFKSIMYSINI